MRLKNEELKLRILDCAKKEFLAHGFLGAQLREIASQAGVTTGSIYKYYKDKNALFDELVHDCATTFRDYYQKIQTGFSSLNVEDQISSLPDVSTEGHDWMTHYIYEHFDTFKLIICCSTGTLYSDYINSLVAIEVDTSKKLIFKMQQAGMKLQPIDDEVIQMLSRALFTGMFETVRCDMPKDKAYTYFLTLRNFYSAGWFKILGLS